MKIQNENIKIIQMYNTKIYESHVQSISIRIQEGPYDMNISRQLIECLP